MGSLSLGSVSKRCCRLWSTWFWVLSYHSIFSFLLEEQNLAQIISKSILLHHLNWRSCYVLGKRQVPHELLMNYKVLGLCRHLSSLGAESGFTIRFSLQQHVVSLICMETVLCIACEFRSKEPERLQVSKANGCHGKACGREEAVLPALWSSASCRL